jgi:iron(III) transport system substrate-binding protein
MKLLADMGRVPSSRAQKTLLDAHTYFMIDPATSIDQAERWEKLWNELFLK